MGGPACGSHGCQGLAWVVTRSRSGSPRAQQSVSSAAAPQKVISACQLCPLRYKTQIFIELQGISVVDCAVLTKTNGAKVMEDL